MDMHKTKREAYAAPTTRLIQVEAESAICGGSVDIANPNDAKLGQINEQGVNQDFSSNAFKDGGWSEQPAQ